MKVHNTGMLKINLIKPLVPADFNLTILCGNFWNKNSFILKISNIPSQSLVKIKMLAHLGT